jgi:transposase
MAKIYVGMDVHKDTVYTAVLPETGGEPLTRQLPNDARVLRRFFARLGRTGPVHACYEASGAGYVLHRALTEWGHHCDVIASSLIPTRPGDPRKHDRKDAVQLARWYRAGELTPIRIPTATEERVRDLVRCRETLQREILQSRHYVLKFLARRDRVYRGGVNWTQRHWTWLRQCQADAGLAAEDQIVLGEYLGLLEYKLQRRGELDRRIETLALTPAYAATVGRLRCYRGLDVHGAMVLATELGDLRRFTRPTQLMAYVGLVPREHSSGGAQRLGPITKAGNHRCRHILVQAAWQYRHAPRVSRLLSLRQQGQPPGVLIHSSKAQHRLHTLFRRLAYRKSSRIAVVAVARELVGFLWASLQDLEGGETAAVAHAA